MREMEISDQYEKKIVKNKEEVDKFPDDRGGEIRSKRTANVFTETATVPKRRRLTF